MAWPVRPTAWLMVWPLARLMALAGTMLALAHTPIGQTVKAMAGV